MAFGASASAADYSAAGTDDFDVHDLPANLGGSKGGSLVVPKSAGQHPLLIAVHGWSAGSKNQIGWAEHFASWGFVVVVPDLPTPFSPDTTTNKNVIVALAQKYQDPNFDSPAKGKIDTTKLGLEGHSAGGLAVTVAAKQLSPTATVLFDPVDKNDEGKAAYATLCNPVLALFAAAGSCNNNAGWSAFKSTTLGPLVVADVVGATHCDGENAPRSLCGPFCGGGADATRQAVHAKYATAFFLARMKGDTAAAAMLETSALSADAELSNTTARATTASSCSGTTTQDAGTKTDGATTPAPSGSTPSKPPSSGSSTGDEEKTGNGANGTTDGAVTPPESSGCHTAAQRVGPEGALVPFAAAFAWLLARRRRNERNER